MGIRHSLLQWLIYRETVRELQAMDSRQLRDVGIRRDDIDRIARRHAERF